MQNIRDLKYAMWTVRVQNKAQVPGPNWRSSRESMYCIYCLIKWKGKEGVGLMQTSLSYGNTGSWEFQDPRHFLHQFTSPYIIYVTRCCLKFRRDVWRFGFTENIVLVFKWLWYLWKIRWKKVFYFPCTLHLLSNFLQGNKGSKIL